MTSASRAKLLRVGEPPAYEPVRAERGQCFHNCFVFASKNLDWTIVHGIVTNAVDGLQMGHAWAEVSHAGIDWVYDVTSDTLLPAAAYYRFGKIEHTVRYSAPETLRRSFKSGNSGPWDIAVYESRGRK